MLQTILSILSVLIAAVGIPILYLQLKDVKATVRSSAHSAIYNQAENLRGYLIEYPHLRKYFFNNEKIKPEKPEYDRVLSIAEIYLNYLEQIAVLKDNFGKENQSSLNSFVAHAFRKSPILRQHLNDNAPPYSATLHKMMEE